MLAALHPQRWAVNKNKLKRLMRAHGLNPPRRGHDLPIFPDRRGDIVDGPNRLRVADLTYVAIVAGFVDVAMIMDVWSRRVVGYAPPQSPDRGSFGHGSTCA